MRIYFQHKGIHFSSNKHTIHNLDWTKTERTSMQTQLPMMNW